MKLLIKMACTVALAVGLTSPVHAETTITGPGNIGTGTYFDYMHTVYARAGAAELAQLPLTSFNKEFELEGLGAESWSLSDDGLVWTFKLREGLLWSDGEPLTATDYVFALTHAATSGYDFAWYWGFAGGIKNWGPVTSDEMDVSELGIKQIDDLTIEVTTETPKPYLPGVVSLWYPVPKHQFDKYGDDWSVDVDTIVTSGPFVLESWEKSNNDMVLVKSPTYNGPWQARVDRVIKETTLADPAVGVPAYLAGEADFTNLNTGQIPFMEERNPDLVRNNVVFALTYLSFNLDMAPFDNVDVRRAFWYAIDREELTQTVLKGLAIPGNSLLTPGYPGYNADIAAKAEFNLDKAREYLAAAGYPNGEGFPEITLETRIGSGYEGAMSPPMAQYLQAEFKENLGITMHISVVPIADWMDSLLGQKGNLYLSPYQFDYLDPSNFFGIFYNGGRHNYHVDAYDALVAKADSNPDWETRLAFYEQAEEVLIDQGMIVPLIHPITNAVVSENLNGEGIEPNALGFTPLDRLNLFFYTHLEKN